MGFSVTVNTTGFMTMARELSRLSGRDYADVCRIEAATTIKMAALGSPVASVTAIINQTHERAETFWSVQRQRFLHHDDVTLTDTGFEISVSNGNRVPAGKVWFSRVGWEVPYLIFDSGPSRGWHVPDAIWHEYLLTAGYRDEYIKARIAELKRRRGIERQSWLQVGDALGVPLSTAPGRPLSEDVARAATAKGRTYTNGTAREATAGAAWSVTVENASPVAIKRNGQNRLNIAINARAKLYQFAVEKNFIADLKFRSSRWPGIFVTG